MPFTADDWIEHLQLSAHVEGGAYRQSYCATFMIPPNILPDTFHGPRPSATAIYFLLQQHEISAMHRIASDELWHFYHGDALEIFEIDATGRLTIHLLGNNPQQLQNFQCMVTAGSWFGSAVKKGGQYALVGCTVSPGFDFADFEMGNREELNALYPQHKEVIEKLTRV